VIDYWWSTPILSVFQLYHGIRHSDWLLVINSDWSWSPIINHCVLFRGITEILTRLELITNNQSLCLIPWYNWNTDKIGDYWWSTPILSVFQLYHGIRHSDWFLVINSNLVSISVMPWYKTQWMIIGDQLQSCQYFSYIMV
jgi:hypothetical protein